jgi:hypothetical protein
MVFLEFPSVPPIVSAAILAASRSSFLGFTMSRHGWPSVSGPTANKSLCCFSLLSGFLIDAA